MENTEHFAEAGKLVSPKKIIIVILILFVLIVGVPNAIMIMTLRQAHREYTTFGKREVEIVRGDMGIQLNNEMTPVKLTFSHGGGDYCYQLWVQDIDDPETFMKDNFAGEYEVTTLDKVWSAETLAYDEGGDPADAEKLYSCKYILESGASHFDYYTLAFYADGDRYKLKAVGSKV